MVSLRDVLPADSDCMHAWRNLPEVRKYMYSDHEISAEEHGNWFAGMMQDPSRKYWIVVSDGVDVGVTNLIQIDKRNSRCCWGFYLANTRGAGVGPAVQFLVIDYVFDELKLNKLCGEVFSWNERGLKLHEGFGFVREGLLRQHIWKDDQFQDIVAFGLLREEWLRTRDQIAESLRARRVDV